MKTAIICAISLDGYINKLDRGKLNWTGKADKDWFETETKRTGVCIMGRTTFETYSMPLDGRLNVVVTHEPKQSHDESVWYTNLEPSAILAEIEKRGFKEASIVGGSKINSLFLAAGVVDELYITLAPHLFGEGIPLVSEISEQDLELIDHRMLEANELLLHYKIIK